MSFRDDAARLRDILTAIERSIVAMRNVLVHEYFGIDHEQVWAVVETDLPALKERLGGLLGTVMAPR
jgi:uncharacterized protein with HEPN domain